MKNMKKIFLLQAWQTSLSHDVCRGVYQFALQRPEWEISCLSMKELAGAVPMKPDGLIAMVSSPEEMNVLADYELPCVLTGTSKELGRLPQVDLDHTASGRAAAEHLLKLGYQNFGALVYGNQSAHRRRAEGFVEYLNERHIDVPVRSVHGYSPDGFRGELIEWLKSCETPLAVFCTADLAGRNLLSACRECELVVPDDVAILGCENDVLICEGLRPQLSSLGLPYRKVGFEAARILDLKMNGKKVNPMRVSLPPGDVHERASTNHLAISDEAIRKSVSFIRRHAHEGISVEDAANYAGLSIRQLQRRFKPAVGHTAAREMQLARVERVKELLSRTDVALSQIATQTGYANEYYLGKNFKKITGITPSGYRQQYLLR